MTDQADTKIRVDYCEIDDSTGFFWWRDPITHGPFNTVGECMDDSGAERALLEPGAMLMDRIQARVPNCPKPAAWGRGHRNALVWPSTAPTSAEAVVVVEVFGPNPPEEQLHVIIGQTQDAPLQESYQSLHVDNIPRAVFERLKSIEEP